MLPFSEDWCALKSRNPSHLLYPKGTPIVYAYGADLDTQQGLRPIVSGTCPLDRNMLTQMKDKQVAMSGNLQDMHGCPSPRCPLCGEPDDYAQAHTAGLGSEERNTRLCELQSFLS